MWSDAFAADRQEVRTLGGEVTGYDDVQNIVAVFPIAGTGDVVSFAEGFGFVTEEVFDLLARPDVELALDTFAVGVFGGVETAVGTRHVAQNVVARAAC